MEPRKCILCGKKLTPETLMDSCAQCIYDWNEKERGRLDRELAPFALCQSFHELLTDLGEAARRLTEQIESDPDHMENFFSGHSKVESLYRHLAVAHLTMAKMWAEWMVREVEREGR